MIIIHQLHTSGRLFFGSPHPGIQRQSSLQEHGSWCGVGMRPPPSGAVEDWCFCCCKHIWQNWVKHPPSGGPSTCFSESVAAVWTSDLVYNQLPMLKHNCPASISFSSKCVLCKSILCHLPTISTMLEAFVFSCYTRLRLPRIVAISEWTIQTQPPFLQWDVCFEGRVIGINIHAAA